MRMARLGWGALALSLATAAWPAWSQTKIDFFFPVPVEGKLAREMTRLVKLYNESQKEVEVVASYTGSYDDTKPKAQAAAKAGKPPSVVLMSANFNVDLKLSGDVVSLEPMLKADETTRENADLGARHLRPDRLRHLQRDGRFDQPGPDRLALHDVVQNGAVGNYRDAMGTDQLGQLMQPAGRAGSHHHEDGAGGLRCQHGCRGPGGNRPVAAKQGAGEVGGDEAGRPNCCTV